MKKKLHSKRSVRSKKIKTFSFKKHFRFIIVCALLILGIPLVYAATSSELSSQIASAAKKPTPTPTSRPTPTPSGPTPTPVPPGSQLYVSPTGNDANPGTQELPFKTIQKAANVVLPGSTVHVASGTYNGNIILSNGGTEGNIVTFRSEVKHGATIVGNQATSNQSAFEINNEYVRLQDFTITGSQVRNGVLINANNVEVLGNHIHTITQWRTGKTSWKGGAGVDIWKSPASNILIDGNYIHHVGAPGSTEQLVHGMYLGVHVTNGRVTNNLIHTVEDFGLHPYDQTEASGWHFINNTISNTGRGILQAPNGVTRNNIVYNTRGARYDIRGTGNVVSNNIASGTGTNVTTTGVTIVADPLFVNPLTDGTGNFRLKPGSPAIDNGTTLQAPSNDYDGVNRPLGTGIDIGAYESY